MVDKLLCYKHEIILFIVACMLLFPGLGKIEVNIMEARNFIAAREMVQNDEYMLTTLNGEPRYQKPPLPTWMTVASGKAFGFDSLAALRLPVTFVTLLLVFAFYYCSKKLLGFSKGRSLNNALILITSFYIFFSGRDNQWDMYTNSFMLISIFFLWKTFQKESGGLPESLLSGLFLGFSLLSKGPVALYALFLPFLISYISIYHISLRKKGWYLLNMLLTGIIIGSSWYIYVRVKDPAYFHAIASKEVTNWTSYEVKPFYYYWKFFLQSGLWALPALTALIYPYLKSRVSDLKAYRFAILWTILSVVLLSLTPEKKVRYVLPSLIPLALTTGFYIEYLIKNFSSVSKNERIWVRLSFGIVSLVGFAYPFAIPFMLKGAISKYIVLYITSSIAIFASAIIIVKGLVSKNFVNVFYSTIALFTIAIAALFPMSDKILINPDYTPSSKVRSIADQYKIKTYRLTKIDPELIWDFGKSIPLIPNAKAGISHEKQFGLMIDAKDTLGMQEQFPEYKIEQLGKIDLNFRNNNRKRLKKDYYLLSLIGHDEKRNID